MSLDSLRNGIVYSMQMNHGTIDSSGQNAAGVNNGATPITTGQKLGTGAYSFDGNDYINLGDKFDANEFTTSGVFTVAHWFKTTIGGVILSKKYSWYSGKISTTNGHYHLTTWSTSGSGVSIPDESNDYRDGKWHLGVAVFNNTTATIYIDGVFKASGPTYVSWSRDTTENTCIGGRQDLQEMFNGLIDNVNIWDRALSSTEVTELYNSGDGLELFPGVADGVISAYKFDGDATDSALSGNDGNIYGATLTTGKINQGYNFDGNDAIQIGDSSFDFAGKNFTMNIWAKFISSNYNFRFLNKEASYGILCDATTGNNKMQWYVWNGSVRSPTISITNGQWDMYTFKYENNLLYCYKNGTQIGSTTSATIVNSDALFTIGNHSLSSSWSIFGIYAISDEFTTWNRALSANEILNLYNEGNGIQYDFIIEEISGFLIKRYNGTSWEEYPVKVYNGTDWIDAKVKRYNGSEWVEL